METNNLLKKKFKCQQVLKMFSLTINQTNAISQITMSYLFFFFALQNAIILKYVGKDIQKLTFLFTTRNIQADDILGKAIWFWQRLQNVLLHVLLILLMIICRILYLFI